MESLDSKSLIHKNMKITITGSDGPKQPESIHDICFRINDIVCCPDFAKVIEKNKIYVVGNSNPNIHSKLCLLIGLYLNSFYQKYECYVSFLTHPEYSVCFNLGRMPLGQFNDFLNSIEDITNVKIDIS